MMIIRVFYLKINKFKLKYNIYFYSKYYYYYY